MKYNINEKEIDILFESTKDPLFCDFFARFFIKKDMEQIVHFSRICISVIQNIEEMEESICEFTFSLSHKGIIIRCLIEKDDTGNYSERYQELYRDSKSGTWTEVDQEVFRSLVDEYIDMQNSNDAEENIMDNENIPEEMPAEEPIAYLLESIGVIYKFQLQTGSLVKSGDKYLLIHPECNILNEYFQTAKRNIEREEIVLSDITKLYKKENIR